MKSMNTSVVRNGTNIRDNGCSKIVGNGFSGIKPTGISYSEMKVPVNAKKVMTEQLKELVELNRFAVAKT